MTTERDDLTTERDEDPAIPGDSTLPEYRVKGVWSGSNGGGVGWDFDHATGEWIMPHIQTRYLLWLLGGKSHPVTTKAAWADLHGVHVDSLKRWRRDSRFREIWEREQKNYWRDPERVGDVMEAMRLAALKGNVQAGKLWLEATGVYVPTSAKNVTQTTTTEGGGDAATLSDEDLLVELDKLRAEIAAGRGDL